MLLKVLGSILVIGASAGIGINNINSLKKRVSALCEISEFMNVIKIKITYELCDIPSALASLSSKYYIAKKCHDHIKSGKSLKDAWGFAIDGLGEEMHLKSQDKSLLKDFCVCLGETDIEGQISNVDMFLELLKKNISESKSKLNDKSKVILSTSMFAGLLISILLI